jgi:serine/threonine-protein kinase RsbW
MIRVAQRLAVEACNQAGLDDEGTMAVELAVSEAVTNVVKHAYRDDDRGFGLLRVETSGDHIQVEVADWGPGFEEFLLKAGPPGKTSTSGYGLLMIQKLMDEVSYRREGDKNVLTMRRFLPVAK